MCMACEIGVFLIVFNFSAHWQQNKHKVKAGLEKVFVRYFLFEIV